MFRILGHLLYHAYKVNGDSDNGVTLAVMDHQCKLGVSVTKCLSVHFIQEW